MGSEIKFILFLIDFFRKVNPSTPRPEGLALPFDKLKGMTAAEGLRVDPERHFFTQP